jgi:hypothetical protein
MRMIDPVALAEAAQDALDLFGELMASPSSGTASHALNPLHGMGQRVSSVGTTEAARCGCGGGGASPATGTTSKCWHPTGTSDAR